VVASRARLVVRSRGIDLIGLGYLCRPAYLRAKSVQGNIGLPLRPGFRAERMAPSQQAVSAYQLTHDATTADAHPAQHG
jgi:hypothetical protein